MKLTIISGRSGSGKSTAIQALEDQGYYCVDNLPVGMLPTLAQQLSEGETAIGHVAVGIDARNLPGQLLAFDNILDALKQQQITSEIIYLDADDNTLLKRFSATRRRHPLATDQRSLEDAIAHEKDLLANIRQRADLVIDSSNHEVHSLRNLIRERVAQRRNALSLQIESFGFKNGLPTDADFVFDVRILPNPHWHPDLRPLTGRDQGVIDFLQKHDISHDLLDDIATFVQRWLTAFAHSDRSYVTVAIGCTGGQHRSVYITEQLAARLREQGITLQVRHRELGSS
ncbi:glmZ(sRNA)-inactivating NTPase [Alcanivorax sp. P2S70]|uniref:RNase adapter RapZ n=1 Tax=Alcanivorax profundi TaxID=2338368 RepID=A0A418XVV0_9GAMM|nr:MULTISPECIES: RNase adapter RapZ [Alcanivorax]ERP91253.1 glmZ(sRNA)-inactivating NTPase [Alcanivorax sp. P2S70]RJG16853.1 RNase adapter RapZ [Alcanivorax profundi]